MENSMKKLLLILLLPVSTLFSSNDSIMQSLHNDMNKHYKTAKKFGKYSVVSYGVYALLDFFSNWEGTLETTTYPKNQPARTTTYTMKPLKVNTRTLIASDAVAFMAKTAGACSAVYAATHFASFCALKYQLKRFKK